MTLERATTQAFVKPWGRSERSPWDGAADGASVGEIWFGRPDPSGKTALLFKLLFTDQPLSVQVHPDDAMAHAMGLPRGKTEAWYVLEARPGARVARGLSAPATADGLRAAIEDGSIIDCINWQTVQPGDVMALPAGTIHALGAGLVIAELQQRSDTTFRLFDFGRGRTLDVENGIAAADHGPVAAAAPLQRTSAIRTLLVACPQFVFERLILPPDWLWEIVAEAETWLLVIAGSITVGAVEAGIGEAVFLEHDRAQLLSGAQGATVLTGVLAAEPDAGFLRDITPPTSAKADA